MPIENYGKEGTITSKGVKCDDSSMIINVVGNDPEGIKRAFEILAKKWKQPSQSNEKER